MSEFSKFAWPLRRVGFRKTYDSRAGGARVVEWRRDEPDGRTLLCQIWEGGNHRVNHEWVGCSDTTPTGFRTEDDMQHAIEHERTRTDSKYRDPNNHYAPGAKEFLLAKQAAATASDERRERAGEER